MRTTTKALSVRDRQKVARIIGPATQAAALARQYVESPEFIQLVGKLVRRELARRPNKEVDHVE